MSSPSAANVPVLTSLDAVVDQVRHAAQPLYVRFSAVPPEAEPEPSVDHDSGLTLPGFAVNPLRPPSWWRDHPLDDWVRRQLATYAHLQEHHPERQCWLLHGTVVERGPDNEPLIGEPETVALVDGAVVAECLSRGEQSDRPEDRSTDSGAAPWQAGADGHPASTDDGSSDRAVRTPWLRRAVPVLLGAAALVAAGGLYAAGAFGDRS